MWRRFVEGIASNWECEVEGRSFSGFGFDPDPPMVSTHDPLRERQPNASAGIFIVGVQALEKSIYALLVTGIDADAVITHGENPFATLAYNADMHLGYPLRATIFDRVSDKVLE